MFRSIRNAMARHNIQGFTLFWLAAMLGVCVMLSGCFGTTKEIVYVDKTRVVSIPESRYELPDVPKPPSPATFMAPPTERERLVMAGKYIQELQGHIHKLRKQITDDLLASQRELQKRYAKENQENQEKAVQAAQEKK